MKKAIFILLCCSALVGAMQSCTKSSQPATPYTQLYGTWKITQQAFDDTKTGKLDSNQLYPLPATDKESILFNRDSTGTHFINENNVKGDFNFNWILINNFTTIRMTTFGGDTITAKVISLVDNMLTLQNNTTPQISWYILQKQ